MTGRPEIMRLLVIWAAMACLVAGCHLPSPETKDPGKSGATRADAKTALAPGTMVPLASAVIKLDNAAAIPPLPTLRVVASPPVVEIAREPARDMPTVVLDRTPQKQADVLVSRIPPPDDSQLASAGTDLTGLPAALTKEITRSREPLLIREDTDKLTATPSNLPANRPVIPIASVEPVSSTPSTQEPPIRGPEVKTFPGVPNLPDSKSLPIPVPPIALPASVVAPNSTSAMPANPIPPVPLPASIVTPNSTSAMSAGPITMGGQTVTFDALARLVDANGGGSADVGCAACGDCGPGRPCAPGSQKCEPFPDGNLVTRLAGLIYEVIVCPDPCYEPHWEAIADSAFFVDSARPVSNTKLMWDYQNHLAYPDRAEYFWAASPKGPAATDGLKAVPYLNVNQLTQVTEIATGPVSVAISTPYRSWDAEPYAHSSAGFSDISIATKTLLLDSELFMCALSMKTFMPVGNPTKGLGDGHVTLEPGLIFGLRLAPETFVQMELQEWIPIGGDQNNAGAFLQWGLSLNQILWQPVRDVKLIGTLELTGYSFQDGLYTDPVLGPQKLSGQNNVALGNGYRVFFGKMDVGVAGNFAITGKYMAREEMQLDFRFRY